jgi:hypothetical protein
MILGRQVRMLENEIRPPGKAVDIMMLLTEETDLLMASAKESACKEANEETEKLLRQYEQKAKQIILKTREEARSRANEITERFREALVLRIEETSTEALIQILAGLGTKSGEIAARLQDAAKHEVRQALAENIVAGITPDPAKSQNQPAPETPVSPQIENNKPEPLPGADFESWLRQ